MRGISSDFELKKEKESRYYSSSPLPGSSRHRLPSSSSPTAGGTMTGAKYVAGAPTAGWGTRRRAVVVVRSWSRREPATGPSPRPPACSCEAAREGFAASREVAVEACWALRASLPGSSRRLRCRCRVPALVRSGMPADPIPCQRRATNLSLSLSCARARTCAHMHTRWR